LLQVKAVLFAVEANIAAVALQGSMAKHFFRTLEPLHVPPQNLPFMRMLRLLDLSFYREYKRLIDDNVIWLGSQFASTNSDFYVCPERKESYGCIVANMYSMKYHFDDGQQLFVSKQTLNEGAKKKLNIAEGSLQGLEAVIAFKRYDGKKDGAGIGAWMRSEHESKGLLPQYVGYHSTDGASNAISSANHYDVLTEMNRDSPIHHDTCMAHQNNRSAKYASGTGDFVVCMNEELRDVLQKLHNVIAKVNRSGDRIKVVRDVQRAAERKVCVLPSASVVTRWDSSNMEVASVNRIMGDFNKALGLLIDGADKRFLISNGVAVPRENFIFSKDERTILRQYECGSEPCLLLSKFFQLNESTCHETLFVITARIAQMRETSFAMYADISHSDVADLTKRTKTLVVNSPHNILSVDEENEKKMEPCILKFRELYSDDLEKRIGLSNGHGQPAVHLPVIIGLAALLNPLYGSTYACF
jgi:hypothetical protein